jgi:hypothetical protein
MRLILSLVAASLLVLQVPAHAGDETASCPTNCLAKQSQDEQRCEALAAQERANCVRHAGLNYRICTVTCKPQSSTPRQLTAMILPAMRSETPR